MRSLLHHTATDYWSFQSKAVCFSAFSFLSVFVSFIMNGPAILILLLEQGDHSLEDHTKDFVFLANLTHYPDSFLCSFYQAGLNAATRAQLSREGPRERLASIEWVLVFCKYPLTVDSPWSHSGPRAQLTISLLHGAKA